ncbi:hypothetical protein TASIC1_0003054800 [Trichoderma asperellum]|uniref:Uncharacterized protein n=1 Tax=Trichoderma asperellum TaxID=101201 RepID=A0A6V8QNX8_TRIAP|nr:hypothetical protein TASIC1_0003054800 [Trichoderma asperellum]
MDPEVALLALAIAPAAATATDSITLDIWFYQDGALCPVPCGPQTSVGFNDTTIPPSLQTNDEQTCTVYWVWSNNGAVSPSCADTVLVTKAEFEY